MKKIWLILLTLFAVSAFMSCPQPLSPHLSSPVVRIQDQIGDMYNGQGGAVSFSVITEYIPEGSTGTIIWYANSSGTTTMTPGPTGVSTVVTAIHNGVASISMSGSTGVVTGQYFFKVIFNSTASLVGVLTIAPAQAVYIGQQVGSIVPGYSGIATFHASTTSIPDDLAGNITWYTNPTGSVTTSSPVGITTTISNTVDSEANITMTSTPATEIGTYYFSVKFGTISSSVTNLTISSSSVALSDQSEVIVSGYAGLTTYTVTTINIQDETEGSLTWYTSISGTTATIAPVGITTSITDVVSSTAILSMEATSSVSSGTYYFTVTYGPAVSTIKTLVVVQPTVSVGTQSGTMRNGFSSTANFYSSTANIPSGTIGSITWYTSLAGSTVMSAPADITSSISPVVSSTFTITHTTGGAASAGSYYFTVSFGSITSSVRTLTVVQPTASLASQVGTMSSGFASAATFAATLAYVPYGTSGTITWFTSLAGTTTASAPAGITPSISLVAGNASTTTMTANSSVSAGSYYFKVSFGPIASQVQTLTVVQPTASISAQIGTLASGFAGSATFTATTTGIPSETSGTFTWYTSLAGTTTTSAPAGITPSATVVIGNSSTANMLASTSAVAGIYYFTISFGPVTSSVGTLTVVQPTASLASQVGTMSSGFASAATFAATLAYVPYGTSGTITWFTSLAGTTTASAPAGITPSISLVAGNASTTTMTANSSVSAGSYYFKVSFGPIASQVQTLTVVQPTASISAQIGTLASGFAGSATFTATTTGIPSETSGTFTWYTSLAGTTTTSAPAGITPSATVVIGNSSTANMLASTSAVAGIYYFTISFGPVTSSVGTLTVVQPSLTVASQVGTVPAGFLVTASFSATTTNIPSGTIGTVTWYTSLAGSTTTSAPTGVSSMVSAVSGNTSTATMTTSASTNPGTYFFTLSFGPIVSSIKTLIILQPEISVASQVGTIGGGYGGAGFEVTTSYVPNGSAGTITWYTNSLGTTASATPTGIWTTTTNVASDSSSISITATTNAVAGSYYFRIGFGSTQSSVQILTVIPVWMDVGSPRFTNQIGGFSFAFSPAGTPFLAFSEHSRGLKASVMEFVGGTWQLVGSAGFSAGAANDITLVFSPSGVPYVAYSDFSYGFKAVVMKYSEGSWSPVGIEGPSVAGARYTKLAFSSSGTPYLAFSDAANGDKLTVMKYSEGSWNPVGSAGFSLGNIDREVSLLISPSGTPYVAYIDNSNSKKATVMEYSGSGWQPVGSAGFSEFRMRQPDLAISNEGILHVAYRDDYISPFKIIMQEFSGGTWVNFNTPKVSGGSAEAPSIAFSPNGILTAAFGELEDGIYKVRVMEYRSGSWVSIGFSSASEGAASFSQLAFSPSGVPHVAYSEGGSLTVRCYK